MILKLQKFTKPPTRGKHGNHFRGTRKSTKLTKLVCLQCSTEFFKKASEVKVRKEIPYCSRQCYYASIKVTKKCLNCSNLLKNTRSVYCQKQCCFDYKKANKLGVKSGFWYENGYRVLYDGTEKGIKEHIKIMQDHIARTLKPNEVVHHKNEVKDDNRLENLQLMTRGEHSSLHRKLELERGKRLFRK